MTSFFAKLIRSISLLLLPVLEFNQAILHRLRFNLHDDRHTPKAAVVPVSHFISDPMLQKEVWKKGFWGKKGNLWLTSDRQLLRIKKRQLA